MSTYVVIFAVVYTHEHRVRATSPEHAIQLAQAWAGFAIPVASCVEVAA